MLEKIRKLIDSTDGLEVHLKIEKQSELVIKGDFGTMVKLLAEMSMETEEISELKMKRNF